VLRGGFLTYIEMKQLLFIVCLLSSFAANAQSISRWWSIPLSTRTPTNTPRIGSTTETWFKAGPGDFYTWSRTNSEWQKNLNTGNLSDYTAYGEISIANDTASISFAATTAVPVEELTSGLMSNFSMVSDSALEYTGDATGKFLINYSLTVSFAEAANIITAYPIINTTAVTRGRSRETVTLTTDKDGIQGSCIVTLNPGDTVRLMVAPSAHTGSDVLTIFECNINVTQLR
jgi:hypothetical protein